MQNLIFLVILPFLCTGEITNNFVRLKGLVRLESYLGELLDDYLKEKTDAPDVVKKFAEEVREITTLALKDVDQYVQHPVNTFLLVRRFTRHWKELRTFLANRHSNGT